MKILKLNLLLSAALLIAGCGALDPSGDELSPDQIAEAGGKADSLGFPAPGNTAARLYFDSDQSFYLNDVTPLDYHLFSARGGASFTVSITATNDEGDVIDTSAQIGFKLYRLAQTSSGKRSWRLITTVDGVQGQASLSYRGTVARYYLVESAGRSKILLHLGCAAADHSACALAGQPGDLCKKKCDSGLYCQYAEGTCGQTGQGLCTVAPASCPKLGLACFPVCGCDGNTYCKGCVVASAQMSVLHDGPCGCDASVFQPGPITTGDSTWIYIDPAANDHYTYTFAGKGGVTSQHDPGCLFATPFHCAIAVRPKHGSYVFDNSSQITLHYDDGTSATFGGEQNCEGTSHLVGTDYGRSLTLTRQ